MAESKTIDEMVDDILGLAPPKSTAPPPAKPRKILAPETRDAIAAAVLDDGEKGIDVAKKYGVTPAAVSKIVSAAKQARNKAAGADKPASEVSPKETIEASEIAVAINDACEAVERLAVLAEHMSDQSWELLYALKRMRGDAI